MEKCFLWGTDASWEEYPPYKMPHKKEKKGTEDMIREEVIMQAKQVDINKIVDYLEIERNPHNQNMIRCPLHEDKTPSLSWYREKNQYHCFGCGHNFDTIDLYRTFTGVSFKDAILDILDIEGIPTSSIVTKTMQNINTSSGSCSDESQEKFDKVLKKSMPIMGYDFNYLHQRGIFVYDTYLYDGELFFKSELDGDILCPACDADRDFALEVKRDGVLYRGIANILKANRIFIMHNFWNSVNNIAYKIDFSYDDDEQLQRDSLFLQDMERQMIILKSEGEEHFKKCLGKSEFIWIADGIGDIKSYAGDVYVCEGIEDALSFVQNGHRAISLNSVNNLHSFIEYLEHSYKPHGKQRFVMAFDHDEAGEKATEKLKEFFENYNQTHKYQYAYGCCDFPKEFHDINDYWKFKVYGKL